MADHFVNIKLSNGKHVQYLDGWPFSNITYGQQPEACVPDKANLSE